MLPHLSYISKLIFFRENIMAFNKKKKKVLIFTQSPFIIYTEKHKNTYTTVSSRLLIWLVELHSKRNYISTHHTHHVSLCGSLSGLPSESLNGSTCGSLSRSLHGSLCRSPSKNHWVDHRADRSGGSLNRSLCGSIKWSLCCPLSASPCK